MYAKSPIAIKTYLFPWSFWITFNFHCLFTMMFQNYPLIGSSSYQLS